MSRLARIKRRPEGACNGRPLYLFWVDSKGLMNQGTTRERFPVGPEGAGHAGRGFGCPMALAVGGREWRPQLVSPTSNEMGNPLRLMEGRDRRLRFHLA